MNPAKLLADGKNMFCGNSLTQAPEFAVFRHALPESHPPHPALAPLMLRHEAEAAWLMARGVDSTLARAAAARAAAQFCMSEPEALPEAARALLPRWLAPMAAEVSPGPLRLAELFGLEARAAERLHEVWGLLGTADELMETGGDIRLARDPKTALNGYGCSHRPRPWAITFASSTASSCSERGYIAADKARLAATAALLRGTPGRKVVAGCIGAVRRGIARAFGLRGGRGDRARGVRHRYRAAGPGAHPSRRNRQAGPKYPHRPGRDRARRADGGARAAFRRGYRLGA